VYHALTQRLGAPEYRRVDVPASPSEKAALGRLSPDDVTAVELAGEPVRQVLSTAPGNDAPIGGVKVVGEHAWFAARPSGTEAVYKVYAESFLGVEHLERVLGEAEQIVRGALGEAEISS
jgi:phosphoglucomutase